jgi:protein-export membrane protein SecD
MILKNPKVLIWIAFVVVSIILIGPNIDPRGYTVKYIEKNSTVTGIAVGDIIYKIDGSDADSAAISASYYGPIKIQTSRGTKTVKANGTLGIYAEKVQPTRLNFGLDFRGGVRAIVEPINNTDNATLDQVISILQNRINLYGLREANFRSVYYEKKGYIEISMAGGSEAELRDLLERQGRFEAKIPILLTGINNSYSITLDKTYYIFTDNETMSIGNNTIGIGQSTELDGILFTYNGDSNNRLNLTTRVFTGLDIKTVYFDPQRSRIENVGNGYRWSFAVQLSPEGAQRFAWVSQNVPVAPVIIGESERYLESNIELYLDNTMLDSLRIAADLKGKAQTEIAITGSAQTKDVASKEKTKLQSILRSGALPTQIRVASMESVSPNLGEGFLNNALLAGLAAVAGISAVIIIRYRRFKLIMPMIIISVSEVIIILGISVVINWTIDLAAMAAIVAIIGTGIDSQIIIIDQVLRKEERMMTMREKLTVAFFVIFGAGGTVIGAMLPLMVLGFGLLRGFAITTIIGVLIGILIARPAFGEIVKKIVGD